ncbi:MULTISPECIES: hypothetical protein [Bradyrhizobium]|uniref:hypothetical protein n=1 Tax=Bradyrhizobium TaxID=374 RepID=UPI001F336D39|nr:MULTISPECIES: hypothetical protein [Bradyrhizobium]
MEALAAAKTAIPAAAQLSAEFQAQFKAAVLTFTAALDDVRPLMLTVLSALRERKDAPTRPASEKGLEKQFVAIS